MDEFTTIMIDMAESRLRLAVAMRDAAMANAVDLPPDKIAKLDAEIAECEAEIARLRSG